MNRKIKTILISFTLCLIMMFSCVSVAAIEDDFVIDTSTVYAVISDDMMLTPYYEDRFYFDDSDYEDTLQIILLENNIASEGLNKADKNIIENCFNQYFICENDEEYIKTIDSVYKKSETKNINGLTTYYVEGLYFFSDDTEYKTPFYGYIFATKENIVILGLESTDGDTEELNEVLATLRINGTYFDGEKPTKVHTFSNVTFEDALAESIENVEATYGDEFYDDSYKNEMGDEEFYEIFEGFSSFFTVIIILVSVVPTIVVIVLAIVFGVKYNKNNKRIKEYENRYGFRGWGVSPNGMKYPYQQNAQMPETFGIFKGIKHSPSPDDVSNNTENK